MGGPGRGRATNPWIESHRINNVPSGHSTNPPIYNGGFIDNLANYAGQFDDYVQGGIRKHVYGQQDDGTYGNPIGAAMGEIFHTDRHTYANHPSGYIGLAGSRGLQAGAVTAAGMGLMNLTRAVTDTFGGGADEMEPGGLHMPY